MRQQRQQAVALAAAAAAAATAAVGFLPRSSVRGDSRGRSLCSFSYDGLGLWRGPFPSYRAQNGPRGERAHLRPTNLIAQHKIK